MFPAVFLDRDGVIIENVASYVRSWDDVAFLPGSLEALARLAASPYKVVMVTNQSAVGRGILRFEEAQIINTRILETIRRAGGRVDGAYICPHGPQDGCDCRKPLPGLLLKAAAELNIDLARSIMVGDALTDLQAGQAAGVMRSFLVLTGRGQGQAALPGAAQLASGGVFPDLAAVLAGWLPKADS
ncbi:MAG: HAD-IIIA family hydrolase [Anaerolineaceae bacterium]|nr:HAD-IIIA family hydrolase [Anaerolineaceae bacterium]